MLQEYIERFNAVSTVDDAADIAATFLESMGLQHFAFSDVSGFLKSGDAKDLQRMITYPRSWTDHYVSMGYGSHDPVNKTACQSDGPFEWSSVLEQPLTRKEQRVMDECYSAGLRHGITVPLFGAMGKIGVVSAAGTSSLDYTEQDISNLSVFAYTLDTTYRKLVSESKVTLVHLTEREREVLTWAATGKSAWDTAQILNISQNTVNFHIKNSCKKLDAANRIMAITKAIRLGLISP